MNYSDRAELILYLKWLRKYNKWTDEEIMRVFGCSKQEYLYFLIQDIIDKLYQMRQSTIIPKYDSLLKWLNKTSQVVLFEDSKTRRQVINKYAGKLLVELKSITPVVLT